jgi:hypothetical protein
MTGALRSELVDTLPEEVSGVGTDIEISDERIREIVSTLGVILHGQIAQAGTFFMHGVGYDHRLALPMDNTEVAAWNSVLGMDKIVEEAISKRLLFMVDIDGAQKEIPGSSGKESPFGSSAKAYSALSTYRGAPGELRVNYGEHEHYWVPRDLVTPVENTDDLVYLIKPELHFGGSQGYPDSSSLYNAFVLLDAFVQAKNGVQLVSPIAGTGSRPGYPHETPVYSPHRAVDTSLCLNTKIKEQPNSISISQDGGRVAVSMSCAINDLDTLPELEIPESEKLRMWFWQLDRLMGDQRLDLPSTLLPQIEAGNN